MNKILYPGPGRIVVEPLPTSQEHDLGNGTKLWLPRESWGEAIIAKVVGIHGKYLKDGEEVESQYALGTTVIIGKHTGTKLTIDRRDFVVITESSVVAELVEPKDEPAQPSV